MTLIDKLKNEYPEVSDWHIEQLKSREKERINQCTETTEFISKNDNGDKIRRFKYTHFTNHRGSKESWQEIK